MPEGMRVFSKNFGVYSRRMNSTLPGRSKASQILCAISLPRSPLPFFIEACRDNSGNIQ